MILVDTSVIADVFTKDPEWFQWSSGQLEDWADRGPLCYNLMVFSELAVKFDTQRELENRLSAFTLLPIPLNGAFQAGKAFEKYRRAGGKKSRPLPDFLLELTPTLPKSLCSRETLAACAAFSPPYSSLYPRINLLRQH
jgi:predicted nucleic acid-binding protein